MAVKIQGAEFPEQPQGQAQQQAFTPKQERLQTPPNFGMMNKLFAYGSGGEYYEKLFEKIQEKIKPLNEDPSKNPEEQYAVIKLLKNASGLNYSGIVIAEKLGSCVSAHILIIERTGEYPEKLTENIAGVRYEILRTPADALDAKYVQSARNAVATFFKVDPAVVEMVDGTLVPNEFDPTNDALVHALVKNAIDAVQSENLIKITRYTGVNIAEILNEYRSGRFTVNLYFNAEGNDHIDQTGMPIRQDICIALSFKVNTNTNNRSVNQGEDTVEIVRVYGYIDFEFVGPMIYNNMPTTQKFVPNFVITHIDSQAAPTPDIVMLGIISALAINEDMNWLQAFKPTMAKKGEIDFNDIGALNIEGNIENNPTGFGKKYDTKAKTFGMVELGRFVNMLVRPNLIISIDVPKAGPETWFTSLFQYIKFQNSQKALDRLYSHIRTLSNGVFTPPPTPVFSDISNKIHGGYYKTKDGLLDIRHLSSYLAVANFIADTNQNPALIAQYTNTLYNTAIPQEFRASERKRYIDQMSNNSAVYKQFHDRLTFSAPFLTSVLMALKTAGFAPMFSNMGISNEMFVKRSTMDFGQAMLGMDARVMGQSNLYSGFFMPGGYYRQW